MPGYHSNQMMPPLSRKAMRALNLGGLSTTEEETEVINETPEGPTDLGTYGGEVIQDTDQNPAGFRIKVGGQWRVIDPNDEMYQPATADVRVPTAKPEVTVDYGTHDGQAITTVNETPAGTQVTLADGSKQIVDKSKLTDKTVTVTPKSEEPPVPEVKADQMTPEGEQSIIDAVKQADTDDPKGTSQQKTKVMDWFQSLGLGEYFDTGQLANMAVQYLGSRLLGYDHGAAANWAIRHYAKRVETAQAETREELKDYKKLKKTELANLKNNKLITDEGYEALTKALAGGNMMAIEEAFGNEEFYTDKYNAGVRSGMKSVKLMHEDDTRPLTGYDLGNGQYFIEGLGVVDHSQGYIKHKSDDEIRDDLYQGLSEEYYYNDKGQKVITLTKQDQADILFDIAGSQKARGGASNPGSYTGHLRNVVDQMNALKIPINKQNVTAFMYGTVVTGSDLKDMTKIASADGTTVLGKTQILGFGNNMNSVFDTDKAHWESKGISSSTDLIRRFDAGWDPTKGFDRRSVSIDDPDWKKLVDNAPNDYMAFIYYSAYSNAPK